jgi:hypothetical protein
MWKTHIGMQVSNASKDYLSAFLKTLNDDLRQMFEHSELSLAIDFVSRGLKRKSNCFEMSFLILTLQLAILTSGCQKQSDCIPTKSD